MPVPWARVLPLLKRTAPRLLALYATARPFLNDAKTRAALQEAAQNLASHSPSRRLRARIDGTVAVARGLADEARDPADRLRADEWVRRGQTLARRLEMPGADFRAQSARRSDVKAKLAALQTEIEAYLDTPR